MKYIMVKYDPYSGGVTEKKLLPSSFFSTFWEEFLKSTIYYQRVKVESC